MKKTWVDLVEKNEHETISLDFWDYLEENHSEATYEQIHTAFDDAPPWFHEFLDTWLDSKFFFDPPQFPEWEKFKADPSIRAQWADPPQAA